MQTAPTPPQPEDRVLRARAAAEFLGVHPATLARWEREGRGPKHHRVGSAKLYLLSSLVAFARGDGE